METHPPYHTGAAAPEPPLTTEALIAQAHAHHQGIPYETGEQLLARLPGRLRALTDYILSGKADAGEVAYAVAALLDRIEHTPALNGTRPMTTALPPIQPCADLPAIRALLAAAGLPVADLAATPPADFWGCREGTALIGVIGLEPYGSVALLRSLAVAPDGQGQGLGTALLAHAERAARRRGARARRDRRPRKAVLRRRSRRSASVRSLVEARAPASPPGAGSVRSGCVDVPSSTIVDENDHRWPEPTQTEGLSG